MIKMNKASHEKKKKKLKEHAHSYIQENSSIIPYRNKFVVETFNKYLQVIGYYMSCFTLFTVMIGLTGFYI